MPFQLGSGGAANMMGGGGGFGFGSLISNPLILQMMASMGANLDPEGAGGAIGNVTNQWIRSQSQMKMMQKLLGSGAKVTFDGKGNKFSITGEPSALSALDESGLSLAQEGSQLPGGSGINWTQQNAPNMARQVNPFVSSQPDVNLADLAGLQGEDINQAMQLLLGQRGIDRQSVADMYDAMYKIGMLKVQMGEKTPSVTIPGTDIKLTRREFIDWYKTASKDERTTAIKNWNEAQAGGYEGTFEDWAVMMAKLSKPEFNIGETVAKTEAVGEAKQRLKATSPDYIPSVVSDLKKDSYTWDNALDPYREKWKAKGITGAEADRLAEKAYVLDEITRRLTIQYGEGNVNVDIINDEIVWKVNGKVVQRY